MRVKYICENTIKHTDKALYLTPSIAIYTYNGALIKSYAVSFAWLVFSFSIEIIIKR